MPPKKTAAVFVGVDQYVIQYGTAAALAKYCDWSQVRGEPYHGAYTQSQLYFYNWHWPQKQVKMPKKWFPQVSVLTPLRHPHSTHTTFLLPLQRILHTQTI